VGSAPATDRAERATVYAEGLCGAKVLVKGLRMRLSNMIQAVEGFTVGDIW